MRAALISTAAILFAAFAGTARAEDDHEDALDFTVESIEGKEVDMESFRGKVVLVVNVASRCGLTDQYSGLQGLYQKHQDQGLVILGFPCNQFAGQEPGSDSEILQFCQSRYDVTFPMFSKVDVNGENATPLYRYLTHQDAQPAGAGDISWNFEKFLIDRQGNVVRRFSPRTPPSNKALTAALEAELKKK